MTVSKGTHGTAGLRDAVMRRLDRLDQIATRSESAAVARSELSRLTDGWRRLLQVHRPDERGRCVACPHRVRGRRWPCQVWRLAHRHLIGDGRDRGERHRPESIELPAADLPGELTLELPVVDAGGARPVRRAE